MTTQSILQSMAAQERAARMKAVMYRVSNPRPGPVRGRVVGRRIQGGNAWQTMQHDGQLFHVREFRG